MTESSVKLAAARRAMDAAGLGAVRLRGTDWFFWLTAGGSNVVLLAAETGVAEALITKDGAWILTNSIEAARLEAEELPAGFSVFAPDWPDSKAADEFAAAQAAGRPVASDRPAPGEAALPAALVLAKRTLLPAELDRYRLLGREAAQAMREALAAAEPGWSEARLAGEGARALLARGIEPALILAGGEARAGKYRHPVPTAAPLGGRAMLVFCARRRGLYANLTRFVYFREPSAAERALSDAAAQVEAAVLAASVPGAGLAALFGILARAYEEQGYPGEQLRHHQGGITGYLSREAVARPDSAERLGRGMALAWNPSLPGAKIEDTVFLGEGGLEVLTADPAWPCRETAGRARPDVWVRK